MSQLARVARAHATVYLRFGAAIAPALPLAPGAVYARYLFAILSRHCALDRTVRAFLLLRDCAPSDAAELAQRLRDGRIGFYNTWPGQIAAFTRAYQANPLWFLPAPRELFADARDRIARGVTGLGPAKTAFALGLIYPFDATVCCIDTHIARMLAPCLGCLPAAVARRYPEAEALLREVAATAGVPLVLAHWILWDHQRHQIGDCTRVASCPLDAPEGSESMRLIRPLLASEQVRGRAVGESGEWPFKEKPNDPDRQSPDRLEAAP